MSVPVPVSAVMTLCVRLYSVSASSFVLDRVCVCACACADDHVCVAVPL